MKSLENEIRQIMFESKKEATQAAYDAAAVRNNPTEFVKKQKEAQKAAAKVAKGGLTPEGGNSIPEEKDEGEYGYEGDMAITQLKTIVRHCDDLISKLKPEEDLPEWVQSKITLATDYIQTASDYMNSVSEEVQEVDENIYGIKPTSVDKGIAAASAEYVKRKKEGTLPNFPKSEPKKPTPEQDAKYKSWLAKKEKQEAKEKAAARKPASEEFNLEIDEGILGTIGKVAKATAASAASKVVRSATPGLYSAVKDIKARVQGYNDKEKAKQDLEKNQEKEAEDRQRRDTRDKLINDRIKAGTSKERAEASKNRAAAARIRQIKKKEDVAAKVTAKKEAVKNAVAAKKEAQKRRTDALKKPAGLYSEQSGAGEIGTTELTKKYIKDTPGQEVNTTNRTSLEKLHKYLQIKQKIIDEV